MCIIKMPCMFCRDSVIREMLMFFSHKYRIMTVVKVKTCIITIVTASLVLVIMLVKTFTTEVFFVICLFLKRQIQIQKHMTCIYTILHRQSTFNLSKQTFCNITLKFQTPRTVSNGNIYMYILFV